ncbi:MAG: FecR family protein [Candidatus Cryptobacteroides sp.]
MDRDTVKRVIDNRGTADEVKQAVKWLRTDEGSAYLSELMSEDFKAISSGNAGDWADCDAPEDEMLDRLVKGIRKSRSAWLRKMALAAAIAIPFLILAGGLVFVSAKTGLFSPVTYSEVNVPSGEMARVILPDGTDVLLNSMSRMRYPSRFSLFERNVELEGEAYFNVVKDKSKPFKVDLSVMEITVLGTKFNVKAYNCEPVRVTLEEGSIRLDDNRSLTRILKPGESAEYNRNSGSCSIVKLIDMEPVTAWKYSRQCFILAPLGEVLRTLERLYGSHFSVQDSSMLDDRYTLSFSNKADIENVLDDIQTVSRARFRKTSTGGWEVYKE